MTDCRRVRAAEVILSSYWQSTIPSAATTARYPLSHEREGVRKLAAEDMVRAAQQPCACPNCVGGAA